MTYGKFLYSGGKMGFTAMVGLRNFVWAFFLDPAHKKGLSAVITQLMTPLFKDFF